MMSRTGKLYDSLDEIEKTYVTILRKEFEQLVRTHISWLLWNKTDIWLTSRCRQFADMDRIEKMEKDIISIRKKLGEPVSEGPVALVEEYVSRYNEGKDDKNVLAKEILAKIRDMEARLRKRGSIGKELSP
jgi:hypothetical protein